MKYMSKEKFSINESALRENASKDGITHYVVGVAILKDAKVLIVRRVPEDYLGGNYELPGGGVEKDETFEEAVIRETREETGLQVIAILGMFNGFDYQSNSKKVRQFNFIVETESGEIKLMPEEHDELLWVDANELENISMSPEMRKSIKNLFNEEENI